MNQDKPQSKPANLVGALIVSMAGNLLSASLWICLFLGVYLKLPHYRKLFNDFETEIGPLAVVVLDYSEILLPAIFIASAACLIANRPERIRTFVLFWLPLLLITGLVIAIGSPLSQLPSRVD